MIRPDVVPETMSRSVTVFQQVVGAPYMCVCDVVVTVGDSQYMGLVYKKPLYSVKGGGMRALTEVTRGGVGSSSIGAPSKLWRVCACVCTEVCTWISVLCVSWGGCVGVSVQSVPASPRTFARQDIHDYLHYLTLFNPWRHASLSRRSQHLSIIPGLLSGLQ